ncbi:MAG: 2-C-methyl-D-erythritol 4-phosphate cytidylyltransferase [Gammaproteobacteria bacterium]|nr:MAG: 2-C-methyl-D-erythritol 4-phosphate cytidylyltransferase [Gammaproteobacteria bacterium]
MSSSPKYWCVVPAAGIGARMKSHVPKQYLPLAGKTIFECTLARLLGFSKLEQVVVAVSAEDPYWPELEFSQHAKVVSVAGGAERSESVLKGLRSLESSADAMDWVLVHDAARPCIRLSDIEKLVDAVAESAVGGLLGFPVQDTIKRSDGERVLETVDRAQLWQAYTPQMFRFGLLLEALQKAQQDAAVVTDEASAVEHFGQQPILVQGSKDNIKITHPEDIGLAEIFLARQAE